MDGREAEADQVVVDDAEIVAVEIAPDDRDERRGDDDRQENRRAGRDRAETPGILRSSASANSMPTRMLPVTAKTVKRRVFQKICCDGRR